MGEGRNEGAEDEAAGTIPSQDHAARQQHTHTASGSESNEDRLYSERRLDQPGEEVQSVLSDA
jgi:hypothetical protein